MITQVNYCRQFNNNNSQIYFLEKYIGEKYNNPIDFLLLLLIIMN
jgi:hypothetical protein